MNRAQLLACELARLATLIPGLGITVFAFLPVLVAIAATWLGARAARAGIGLPGRAIATPTWVAATLVAVLVYALARIADPLLHGRLQRPADVDPRLWERVSYWEWRAFGADWGRAIVPLDMHADIGVALHCLIWPPFIVLVAAMLQRFVVREVPGGLSWTTEQRDLPFFHRWTGASTARRADGRFRSWARPLWTAVMLAHVLAGWLFYVRYQVGAPPTTLACQAGERPAEVLPAFYADAAEEPVEHARDEARPSAGAWVLALFLLTITGMHLATRARAPSSPQKKKDERDPGPSAPPPASAIDRLREALGGSRLSAEPSRVAARDGARVPLASGTPAVAVECLEQLTGATELYAHQRAVLDHLASRWRTTPVRARSAAPELREERLEAPFRAGESDGEHVLVVLPEGTGRSTLCALAAISVYLDRGATSLVIAPDAEVARAFAARVRTAVERTAARWNVAVAIAGEDLASILPAERTPAIVIADLESLERDVLGDPRTEAFFARLGLACVLGLDEHTGVREMHLHLLVRRVWALLDTVHDAPYPPVWLATAGPSAEGIGEWARHVLSARLAIFDRDGAPRPAQALLTRRDLIRDDGEPVRVADIAEACARAGLRWHLRAAGDGRRSIRRAEIDLAHVEGHVADPLDAEVVILEGRLPDVRRERARLARAGVRTPGEALIVLAAPGGDELVLHEEADDAPLRARIDALPRAVPLSEPELVRQRHFDRALGREQDVDALRARLGASFVDQTLARMRESGRIVERTLYELDRSTDEARARGRVRSANEAAIGEPICATCVGESSVRVTLLDEGTREVIRELDGACALALHPPGSLHLDRRGRYLVRDPGGDAATILAAHGAAAGRTTAERTVSLEPARRPDRTERALGGAPLVLALARVEVSETFHGVRRYAPGPALVERRVYVSPLVASYSTDACLVALDLPRGAEIPLIAALRMMLPCLVRACDELADVEAVTIADERWIAFFDRTPGASGIARWIHDEGAGDLLRLARAALERLVGAEAERLRALHDTSLDGEHVPWRTHDALAWLDRCLDAAPRPRAEHATIGWSEGEGPGDLGRLWITPSGRADDLAWTRHAWTSDVALAGAPPGPVHLDVAIERSAIATALRDARDLPAGLSAAPLAIGWRAAIERAERDLAPIAERLRVLAGEHYVDAVLAIVAAIPTRAAPLPPPERAPLVALARRRADPEAKALIALALLRAHGATLLQGPHGLLVHPGPHAPHAFDLSRSPPRPVLDSESSAAVLVLD